MYDRNVRKNFLKALHKVGYARIINFAPFLQHNTTTPDSYKVMAYKMFRWASDWNFIKAIKLPGKDPARVGRGEPFYCLTVAGAEYIGVHKYKNYDEKRISNIDHETAKIDCLLSFVYNFPKYVIDIKYGIIFEGYKPDAFIQMWPVDDCTKKYSFIFELERSRKPLGVVNEKIVRIEKIKFKEKLRILFVYAHPYFPINLRPIEYKSEFINANKDYLNKLMLLVKKYPPYKYRFTSLHEFTNLHKSVWVTPKGDKIKLINQ